MRNGTKKSLLQKNVAPEDREQHFNTVKMPYTKFSWIVWSLD